MADGRELLSGQVADEAPHDTPWHGWGDDPAHPRAHAGGGGPGQFGSPQPAGADSVDAPYAHPNSPAGQLYGPHPGAAAGDTVNADQAQPQKKPAKPKPAPATNARTGQGQKKSTNLVDIDVKFKVLADKTNSGDARAQNGGFTIADDSDVKETFATYDFNYTSHEENDTNTEITKFTSKFTLKGTVKIRTTYGKMDDGTKVSKNLRSRYGRGTTEDDIQNGDVSIGFHEKCHRDDTVNYLKANKFPVPEMRVGMSVADYKKETSTYGDKLNAYFTAMDDDSVAKTDEVGYTFSKCVADGKCTAGRH